MPWSRDKRSASELVTDVPAWTVYRSRATAFGPRPPKWTNFYPFDALKVVGIFYGSSVAGPSYARLKYTPGLPGVVDPPEETDILLPGDRVIIALGRDPMFAGIMVMAELGIDDAEESLTYRIAGPEWYWGGETPNRGQSTTAVGQVRRTSQADDEWAADPNNVVTSWAKLIQFTGEPWIFNPGNRANMTTDNVWLTTIENEEKGLKGRCFDNTDRKLTGTSRTEPWTVDFATMLVMKTLNDPDDTGIDVEDWSMAQSLYLGRNPLGTSRVLKNCDIEGLGIWGALKKILAPDLGFYIDPRPTKLDRWGGFKLVFFSRVTGDEAFFYLGVRGENIADAAKSIKRIQAVKTIDSTVNKATVYGASFRHLELQYCGGQTGSLSAEQKKVALQHGWTKGDGDLHTYAAEGIVDEATVDQADGTGDTWRSKYVVGGSDFIKNRHVFRFFVWNEAGEFRASAGGGDTAKPRYYNANAGTTVDWWTPDLEGIADGTGNFSPPANIGVYTRRRRKFLDTAFRDGSLDEWRRVKPTLWIAATTAVNADVAKYRMVSSSNWTIDPERGGIWITHDDVAKWQPLYDRKLEDAGIVQDDRSFATLLYSGQLRLLIQCSVETDWAMECNADRQDISGAPQVRVVTHRAPTDYVLTQNYTGNPWPIPGSPTAVPLDQSEEASGYASQLREVGQDAKVHASIMATATWSLQPIGGMVKTTLGRELTLATPEGRGAQIVGAHLDPEAMCMEYLTETAALELRQIHRIEIASRKKARKLGPLMGRPDAAAMAPAKASPMVLPPIAGQGA